MAPCAREKYPLLLSAQCSTFPRNNVRVSARMRLPEMRCGFCANMRSDHCLKCRLNKGAKLKLARVSACIHLPEMPREQDEGPKLELACSVSLALNYNYSKHAPPSAPSDRRIASALVSVHPGKNRACAHKHFAVVSRHAWAQSAPDSRYDVSASRQVRRPRSHQKSFAVQLCRGIAGVAVVSSKCAAMVLRLGQ